MNILDIRIDNLSYSEILEKVELFLSDGGPRTISEDTSNFANNDGGKVRGKFHQIATVNPEFILEAQKDEEFRNILNQSDLNVADGIGIWFAFLRFGKFLKARIAGADLMDEILRIANEKKLSVFLAINKNGLSSYEEIRNALSPKYPDIELDGANLDPQCHSERSEESPKIINNSAVTGSFDFSQDDKKNIDILFVNFGAPFQEKFINSLKDAKINVAMGVGGSFDFITGKVKRAPKVMRYFGLEWLWRLILQPKRIRRILNAVIFFPIKVLVK